MRASIDFRGQIAALVIQAMQAAVASGDLPEFEIPEHITVDPSRHESHGDYGTPVCLSLARVLRMAPINIAQAIQSHIPEADFIQKTEVAQPGFVNFTLAPIWLASQVQTIMDAGEEWGNVDFGEGQRVQVEYVSANPTGPITVATTRNAVIGDSIATVLSAAGYDVSKEYYVNDAGSKVANFGGSLLSRYAGLFGVDIPFPEKGYPGSYVLDMAKQIKDEAGDRYLHMDRAEAVRSLGLWGIDRVLETVVDDLASLNIHFDNWFSERSLYTSGLFDEMMAKLREGGYIREYDGATWFSHPDLEKDAVLIRSPQVIPAPEGRPTYLASDIPYLWNKLVVRNFDKAIYIWAADHHGDVPRVLAAAKALGVDQDRLVIIVYQMVNMMRGGKEVRMSKSSGEFVTLRELVDEVGPDCIRFMMLTRTADVTINFDLDLAVEQSDRNPVYYVQYAHTRIAGILRHAAELGISVSDKAELSLLTHPSELALIIKMLTLPEIVTLAARTLATHHLTTYATELASAFHAFYRDCRIVSTLPQDGEITQARLKLAQSSKLVLARVLHLMGMTAPDRM
jgi:arginyl-tRNA synthetase